MLNLKSQINNFISKSHFKMKDGDPPNSVLILLQLHRTAAGTSKGFTVTIDFKVIYIILINHDDKNYLGFPIESEIYCLLTGIPLIRSSWSFHKSNERGNFSFTKTRLETCLYLDDILCISNS